MAFIHSSKGTGKKIRMHLAEDFRDPDREPAVYSFALDGFQLTGDSLRSLLKEFCRSESPLLQLYMIGHGGEEELRDVKVHKLGRRVLRLSDLGPDREATSFMRRHCRVRFGFEHRGQNYFFETRVVGAAEEAGTVLVAERPESIYQERRKHPHYHLWPECQAFLGWMQVLDISWNGLRIFSETLFREGDVLENALLLLPQVHHTATGERLFSEARIKVPSAVVVSRIKKQTRYFYGLYFDREWPEERAEKLRDFLRAISVCDLSGGSSGKAFCFEYE